MTNIANVVVCRAGKISAFHPLAVRRTGRGSKGVRLVTSVGRVEARVVLVALIEGKAAVTAI